MLSERMLKVRSEKRKLYPSCARCGKNHKNVCLWGKNACYRCGKPGHKLRDCRVKGKNLQVLRAPKRQVAPIAKERLLFPSCAKCGKNHKGECLMGTDVCFRCGKLGHYARDCRGKNVRPQGQVGQNSSGKLCVLIAIIMSARRMGLIDMA